MTKKRESYRKKGLTTSNVSFHERFQITLRIEDIKRRFVNRVKNQIFYDFFDYVVDIDGLEMGLWAHINRRVANVLGEEYSWTKQCEDYTHDDFHRTLQVLELAYNTLAHCRKSEQQYKQNELSGLISSIIGQSEMDLGVTWEGNCFVKSGAELLDKGLINEPLKWLANRKYSTVYNPYEKGLKHYLESEKDPSKLSDAITNIYEALEALAKIVTNRPRKDLSSNAELFISKVGGNEYHKEMLKAHIAYANHFRHALEPSQTKREPDPPEVENFIYLTGIFIRLAIEKLDRVNRTK